MFCFICYHLMKMLRFMDDNMDKNMADNIIVPI